MRFQLDVIGPGPGSVPGGFLFTTDFELVLTITSILFALAVLTAVVVLVVKAVTEDRKPKEADPEPDDDEDAGDEDGKTSGKG